MVRSLEEEKEVESGVHEIRVSVWGFGERVTSIEFHRERDQRSEERGRRRRGFVFLSFFNSFFV